MIYSDNITIDASYSHQFLVPLQMEWKPKEDITAYELALCLPYLNRHTMAFEINISEMEFLRHFEITDHNKK